MTRIPIRRSGLVLLSMLLPLSPLAAEEKDPRELLRDALYTEEVTRDPDAAARQYQEIVEQHDARRAFAASALFRLAEIRRKQDRKDEAVALYQRLLREFPAAEAEGKLAREHLAALGAKVEPAGDPGEDEETRELRKLQQWVESSPDRLKDPELLLEAVKEGRLKSIEFLLAAGSAATPWKLLEQAVETGNLRVIELLLDHPFDSHRGIDSALFLAVTLEYSDVARLLLTRGANPNYLGFYHTSDNASTSSTTLARMTTLHVAVRKRDMALCKLLLNHKADPNLIPDDLKPPNSAYETMLGRPTGTALHDAVVCSLEITRLLLENGGDVNAAPPETGFTPLHSAVRPSHLVEEDSRLKILGLLIEKGANLEAATVGPVNPTPTDSSRSRRSRTETDVPPGGTPLRLAVMRRNIPAVDLLLQVGASAKHPGILSAAIDTLRPELVGKVLAEGALEAETSADPIRILASKDLDAQLSAAREKIFDLLLQHGAKPEPAWVAQHFEGASPSSLPFLYHHFLVPRLLEKPAITVITPAFGSIPPIELASGTAAEPPPDLAMLLLQSNARWALVDHSGHFPILLTRWRKNADGTPEAVRVDLSGSEPLPDLRWGDVIEFASDREQIAAFNYSDRLPSEIIWHLRKRISLPVTVEIDGASRELTLRGDRLIFDPASDQVPWTGASRLASLLWQPEVSRGGLPEPELSVVREGWPDVVVPWDPNSPSDFALQAGDRLVIKTPPPPEDLIERRKKHAVVRGSGLPFVRFYGSDPVNQNLDEPAPASLPTLIQALADIPASPSGTLRSAAADLEALPASLMRSPDVPIQVLSHPDYSKIVIRRLNPDGTEKRIPVDLAAVIANSTDATTPKEARKADVILEPGDIVEVAQISGLAGSPWKGPSEAESRFFAKALDCKVQVIAQQGGIELREIHYQTPRFVEVAGNWLPLPPLSGTATMNAGVALDQGTNVIKLTRRGEKQVQELPASEAYLRDGDVISTSSPARSSVPPPPQRPEPQRQPRPRVVPPPSR